ncbi:MAG: AmmeMemoRadiSam system protein A [Nitrospirae bacterium]|nr:AmmeMemoRadiSam system protein A [Nitrospirota bacterium]
MHPLVKLVKESIETYIKEKKVIDPPKNLLPEMVEKAGVFVCIKKHGHLRGCIGTYNPCCDNVALETIRNAICAATRDPRFNIVTENELKDLEYSVDILSPPQKVTDLTELNPKKYGIIIVSGNKGGILLPDLEGVNTIEEQINIVKMKAFIAPEEDFEIYKFEAKRYK